MSETAELKELARIILEERNKPRVTLIMGEVDATPGGGLLDVRIQGDEVPVSNVRYLSSYTPAVGDTVWMIKHGAVSIVLGTLA